MRRTALLAPRWVMEESFSRHRRPSCLVIYLSSNDVSSLLHRRRRSTYNRCRAYALFSLARAHTTWVRILYTHHTFYTRLQCTHTLHTRSYYPHHTQCALHTHTLPTLHLRDAPHTPPHTPTPLVPHIPYHTTVTDGSYRTLRRCLTTTYRLVCLPHGYTHCGYTYVLTHHHTTTTTHHLHTQLCPFTVGSPPGPHSFTYTHRAPHRVTHLHTRST